MRHAGCTFRRVTLFDRRKGYGEHTMDRRRTYVDIMERVLGNDMLIHKPGQLSRFPTDLRLAGTPLGLAVSSIEVTVLDSIGDQKA
jgi:hypothetical protein